MQTNSGALLSTMLNDPQLQKLMTEIVNGRLPKVQLQQVMTDTFTDSKGEDALRITLVLTPDSVRELTGDETLDLLVEVQNSLQREGEDRFAIIEYATEEELLEEDDAD